MITVRKEKYDGTLRSAWEGERLPAPDSQWVVVQHHPQRHKKFTEGEWVDHDLLFIHFLNLEKPLTVLSTYTPDGYFREAKCDAALPAVIESEELIRFVDLDLDVIVHADLAYHHQDEVDFAENMKKMGYTQAVVEQAHAGLALARKLVEARAFPFNVGWVPRLKDGLL